MLYIILHAKLHPTSSRLLLLLPPWVTLLASRLGCNGESQQPTQRGVAAEPVVVLASPAL